ncbi:MAG: hypothetical protein K2O81_03495 [Clostridia bacterium]|nr:hypothetical protein [Clostridia bacterium]
MFKRANKRHGGFNTQTVETVILGGKTDYCAERFGYKRETNGILPALAITPVEPSIKFNYVVFAEYLPLCGLSIFTSRYGQFSEWKSGDTGVKTVGVITHYYPVVHPTIIDGEKKYAVMSSNYLLTISQSGAAQPSQLYAKLYTSIMHCGRIFGCDLDDRYKIKWSGYGVNEWVEDPDGAGYVRLNMRLGKALNLFSMNEKVVVVREYGITVISTLGDFRHMRIASDDTLRLPPVYDNSSAICRGLLWIYTHGGMYVFDGKTISAAPFDETMSDYVLEKPKVADDRYIYYTATRGDGKCLFVYDTETGDCTPFANGCQCQFFTPDGAYCFNDTVLCSLSENIDDSDRKWISKPVDLGTGKTKTLKSLLVEGSGKPVVEIDCDGRVLQADGVGETKFSECGRSFIFKVTGNGAVTRLAAEWEVRK